MPISININVDKVDRKRFFEGKKGKYLDLVLFETPESDYGDYLVKQRGDKGEKMCILGNAKIFKLKGDKGGKSERSSDNESGGSDPW